MHSIESTKPQEKIIQELNKYTKEHLINHKKGQNTEKKSEES